MSSAAKSYTYLHLPIVAVIIATAVASNLLISDPHQTPDDIGTAMILGGPALYLLGVTLFRRCTIGQLSALPKALVVNPRAQHAVLWSRTQSGARHVHCTDRHQGDLRVQEAAARDAAIIFRVKRRKRRPVRIAWSTAAIAARAIRRRRSTRPSRGPLAGWRVRTHSIRSRAPGAARAVDPSGGDRRPPRRALRHRAGVQGGQRTRRANLDLPTDRPAPLGDYTAKRRTFAPPAGGERAAQRRQRLLPLRAAARPHTPRRCSYPWRLSHKSVHKPAHQLVVGQHCLRHADRPFRWAEPRQ